MQKISPQSCQTKILTFNHLMRANYELAGPFLLKCPKNDFLIIRVLRHLPGSRLTALIDIEGQEVLLKLFYGGFLKHIRHAWREGSGYRKLATNNFLTPKLQNLQYHAQYAYAMFDYLSQAEVFQDCWLSSSFQKQHLLLIELVKFMARMHMAGLMHRDLHFKNFLIDKGQLYVIDMAAIMGHGKPALSKTKSIQNIGLLFAQIKRHQKSLLEVLFNTYLKHRNWTALSKKHLLQQRWEHETKVLKRTMRNCSDYHKSNSFFWAMIVVRATLTINNQQLLQGLLLDNNHQPKRYFKQGNSTTLWQSHLGVQKIIIKRYNIKHFWHAMKRALRPSRAANSWRFGHFLQYQAIATPMPIAFAEKRFGWLRGQAYLIYQYQSGVNLAEYLQNYDAKDDQWQLIIRQVVLLLRRLADAQLIHGDLKATNFLVEEQCVYMLDLDSMTRISSLRRWKRKWQKERKRFLANFVEDDKIRAYCLEALQQVDL